MRKYILFFVVLLLVSFPFFAAYPSFGKERKEEKVPGHVIVKFLESVGAPAIDQELRKHDAKVEKKLDRLGVLVLTVPLGREESIVSSLSRNPSVEYAEVDSLAYALFTPNDPQFSKQWGLDNIGQLVQTTIGKADADIDAPESWDTTQGGVWVAILDTGIDQDHEDISSKVVMDENFSDSPTIDDLYGHGTHVAGIVAAVTDNGTGVAGGCPTCELISGKVLNDSGSGAYSWIANGITWATDSGAKVINMSLGGSASSRTLENAVKYAWNHDVVVVAAAGNSSNQSKIYPAAYTNAIAVAATNNKDQKASFSSYGNKWVDVAAPGENIYSTFPNHDNYIHSEYGRALNYDYASGTSMATPMTSAVAALVWSTPYGTSASAVRNRVESTADKISGTGKYWAKGRINAQRAVAP
ncbi:MAG TPA: S8 family peptidase [Patescibacteria group bacterium]|nr:S8 family peptidase [Patescibacteria group bacterium]